MTNKKKIICLVIPTLKPGGMERVMTELANYFVLKSDLEVHLILYGISHDIFYNLSEKVNVHKPTFQFNNSKRLYYTFRTIFFLRKRINSLQPDTILSFGEIWNNFVLLSLFGLKYPIYISDRCDPNKKLSFFQSILQKWLYPHATGIIFQTQLAWEIGSKRFKCKNVAVIGNPIRNISNDNSKYRKNQIISVGRLIDSKNYDLLIKVFADINLPEWKLYIIGDDAQKQNNKIKLMKLIAELGLRDRVYLPGFIKDVESFYLESKIFAFMSTSEGFPNVVGEAISAGLPVVAFDGVPGVIDLVDDGINGYLIPLFDLEAFKNKLLSLMLDESLCLKLGNNGKNKVANYSIQRIGDRFLNFILSPTHS